MLCLWAPDASQLHAVCSEYAAALTAALLAAVSPTQGCIGFFVWGWGVGRKRVQAGLDFVQLPSFVLVPKIRTIDKKISSELLW